MAFNPFVSFRKHKRVLFAGLTIVCMITFVLSSGVAGVGDFFSWVSGRGGQGRERQLTTVYGKKVTERSLLDLAEQRQTMSDLLLTLYSVGVNKAVQDIEEALPKENANPRQGDPVRQMLSMRSRAYQAARVKDPKIRKMYQPPLEERDTQAYLGYIPTFLQQMEFQRIHQLPGMKTLEPDQIDRITRILETDLWALRKPQDELYFGGSKAPEDLLDFLVWRNQADQLGIQLKPSDVAKLVNHESFGFTKLKGDIKEDRADILSFLDTRNDRKPLDDKFYQALGDEFRVAMAQSVILGRVPGIRGYSRAAMTLGGPPSFITPMEFWEYYKKNRTTLAIKLLLVPTTAFKADPRIGEPSADEIKTLYNRYRDLEPSLQFSQPGFKVPRQVKVEWISASPDADYFKKSGALLGAILRGPGLGMGLADSFGMGGVGNLAAISLPVVPDLMVFAEYKEYLDKQKAYLASFEASYRSQLETAYFVTFTKDPQIVARAVGRVLGDVATAGASFVAPVVQAADSLVHQPLGSGPRIMATTIVQALAFTDPVSMALAAQGTYECLVRGEMKTASRVGLALSMLGGSADAPLSALALPQAVDLEPIPLASWRVHLNQGLDRKLAYLKAVTELNDVFKELSNRKNRVKDARDWLAKDLAKSGFTQHHVTALRDRFNIVKDPEIQFLKEEYTREFPLDRDLSSFPQLFFSPDATKLFSPHVLPARDGELVEKADLLNKGFSFSNFTMEGFQAFQESSTYKMLYDSQERQFLTSSEDAKSNQLVLYWVADEKAAYVPELEEARPQVVAVWKLQQARDLARKEAKRIAEELKGSKDDHGLYDAARPHNWQVITVLNIARLQEMPARRGSYTPYRLDDYVRETMPYPDPHFADRLLNNLKNTGDTTYLADSPETYHCVAWLEYRSEPDEERFFSEVYSRIPMGDQLWRDMALQANADNLRDVASQLRLEAGLPGVIDQEGNWTEDAFGKELTESLRKMGRNGSSE